MQQVGFCQQDQLQFHSQTCHLLDRHNGRMSSQNLLLHFQEKQLCVTKQGWPILVVCTVQQQAKCTTVFFIGTKITLPAYSPTSFPLSNIINEEPGSFILNYCTHLWWRAQYILGKRYSKGTNQLLFAVGKPD